MKKILGVICVVLALGLAACEKPDYGTTPNTTIASLGTPENNEIWFITTDDAPLRQIDASAFNCKIADIIYSELGINIIRFESDVTTIGERAFDGCHNLYNISLPNSVTEIGAKAFYDCKNMECLTLGNSLRRCGSMAFDGCFNLYSLHIPSVRSWCSIAFESKTANPAYYSQSLIIEREKIRHFNIPSGVTSISKYAFAGNTLLASITIPASVKEIGADAFVECDGLRSVTIESLKAWCSIDFGNEQANPISLAGTLNSKDGVVTDLSLDSVDEIKAQAFIGCNSLRSVSLGNATQKIGMEAFRACSELASITLGDGITEIGEKAFIGCCSLNNIVLPKNISSIGNNAFNGCTSLQNITIPDRVIIIDNSLFRNCTGLHNITIPNSVISIGESAFENCTALQEITIPESIETIGRYAFKGCSALKHFYGKFASSDNRALIIDKVLEVYAIGNAETEYNVPSEITRIQDSAFFQCKRLKKVTIPDSVTSIGASAFIACSALTDVTLPDYIRCIEKATFKECLSLKVVNIPEGVTSIGKEAFKECSSLAEISLPDSITDIEDVAFKNCSSLAKVICKATTPPTLNGLYVFSENSANRKFYVPRESLDEYKKYSDWSRYADSIEALN